jgi:hypothetical protein
VKKILNIISNIMFSLLFRILITVIAIVIVVFGIMQSCGANPITFFQELIARL